jgi:hypothetical protein
MYAIGTRGKRHVQNFEHCLFDLHVLQTFNEVPYLPPRRVTQVWHLIARVCIQAGDGAAISCMAPFICNLHKALHTL